MSDPELPPTRHYLSEKTSKLSKVKDQPLAAPLDLPESAPEIRGPSSDYTAPQVMTLGEVLAYIPMSRSAIYAALDRGEFPRPFKLGERKNGWLKSDIDAWLIARAKAAQASA